MHLKMFGAVSSMQLKIKTEKKEIEEVKSFLFNCNIS